MNQWGEALVAWTDPEYKCLYGDLPHQKIHFPTVPFLYTGYNNQLSSLMHLSQPLALVHYHFYGQYFVK